MSKLICEVCGEPMWSTGNGSTTLIGYVSPAGHDHNDNCRIQSYQCENGHMNHVSVINRCPNPDCDWTGQTSCFCHEGDKLEEWPE